MRAAATERGQAAVEALALWLLLAALIALLLAGLPRVAPYLAAVLAGDRSGPAAPEPSAAALADRVLAGRAGAGGVPSLLAAQRLLALDLGEAGAHRYLQERLLQRHGARLGRQLDATFLVGGMAPASDHLIAHPTARPTLRVAELADEPPPSLDDASRRMAEQSATDGALWALEQVRAARLLSKMLAGAQVGKAVVGFLVPSGEIGPRPGERAGDGVLCEPVELRWTMGGDADRRPLALALHVVVVRASRVIDDRLLDGERCA